jgi:hypothetical protein
MATGKKALYFGSRAERELAGFKHRDLQRACVIRGMPFEEVVQSSDLQLASWFMKHYENGMNHVLLDEFDAWKLQILKGLGYEKDHPYHHPQMRLGFIGEVDDDGNAITSKKPRLMGSSKQSKKKRQRNKEFNIFTGTKKELTFRLTKEGKDIKEIIKLVKEKFPDAKEKSIKIWSKSAKKGK